jgi:ELWxxDGT repeat protein
VAYFAGLSDAGFPGYGLWKTDGTDAGTMMVKGFPYDDPHAPAEILSIVPTGDVTFVKVKTSEGKLELWATDGSEAGTVFVMEIVQAYEPYSGVPPLPDVGLDGRLFFTHDDGVHGPELWTSDGTPAGTKLVNDLLAGEEGVGAISFFVHDGTVYFQSADRALDETSYSYGLFKVEDDGAGGFRTPLLVGAPFGVEAFHYAALDGAIYFTTRRSDYDGLYTLGRLDPAAGGSTLVKDFLATPELVAYDGRLYFVDYDAEHGYEPWVTDGSPYGARLLKDIYPGDIGSMYETRAEYPNDRRTPQFTFAAGKLYFVARDAVHGRHLFVTDGTPGGTRVAAVTRQREPGVEDSEPTILLGTDDDLYFASDHARFGYELFHLHPDAMLPAIVSAAYHVATPTPSIAIRFSEDVEHALETNSPTVRRTIPPASSTSPTTARRIPRGYACAARSRTAVMSWPCATAAPSPTRRSTRWRPGTFCASRTSPGT